MKKRINPKYLTIRRQVFASVWEALKAEYSMAEVAENIFRVDVGNFYREIAKAMGEETIKED